MCVCACMCLQLWSLLQDWAFLARFCFLSESGRLQFEFEYPEVRTRAIDSSEHPEIRRLVSSQISAIRIDFCLFVCLSVSLFSLSVFFSQQHTLSLSASLSVSAPSLPVSLCLSLLYLSSVTLFHFSLSVILPFFPLQPCFPCPLFFLTTLRPSLRLTPVSIQASGFSLPVSHFRCLVLQSYHPQKVLLYYDEADQWPAVYKKDIVSSHTSHLLSYVSVTLDDALLTSRVGSHISAICNDVSVNVASTATLGSVW